MDTLTRINRQIEQLQHKLNNAEIMSRCTPQNEFHRTVINRYKGLVEIYRLDIKNLRQLYCEYLQKREFVIREVI